MVERQDLPEKYRFDERVLENYTPGDTFPTFCCKDGPEIEVSVSMPEHPLAGFTQFYIDNVVQFHRSRGVWDSLFYPALRERDFLNKQLGVPGPSVLSRKEMEEKNYFGSIERLKVYVSELENAVNVAIAKGILVDEFPLKDLIKQKSEAKCKLQAILNAEGKSSFAIFKME